MNNLEEMNRKELQALAKQHGIKANLSNAAIIDQLMPILGATAAAEVDEVPEVESVVVAPVVEIVPEPVQVVESKVEARKSILVFEEAPGPFTIPHQEVDSIPQATASVDDAQVGDVIEVLEAGEWQPATIKRVNKVSFRVSLQSTGREVTVKMTDARMIVTISNEAEVEVESAVKTPIEDAPEEMENEVEATEEVDGIEDHASEDEEDVTIPDEELMAALMDDDEEEEQEEEGEAMDEEYDEEEIDDMAAAEDIIAPSQARKSACQKRTSSMLLGATPKKARTSELPIWNSSTKSDSYSFDVGAAPASAKKAPGSIRKSFANAATPNPNKPAIVPKMNMTQKLRMEALQKQKNAPATNPLPKKSTPLVGNKVTPIVAKVTPLTAKISSVVSKTLSEKQNKVQFNFTERVKTAPTPSSVNSAKPAAVQKKSSTTPNFNRMHQKQFNNSKPITSCVERVSFNYIIVTVANRLIFNRLKHRTMM